MNLNSHEWIHIRLWCCNIVAAVKFVSNGHLSGLILGLRSANERRRYFVTMSLTGWVQAQNQPCLCARRYIVSNMDKELHCQESSLAIYWVPVWGNFNLMLTQHELGRHKQVVFWGWFQECCLNFSPYIIMHYSFFCNLNRIWWLYKSSLVK